MCEIWSWSENLTMPCVQFLMKIVESALCSAYDESKRGTHIMVTRLASEAKGRYVLCRTS
jgi:hypothetical protein